MHVHYSNIGLTVFGGAVRPEPRLVSHTNSGIGAFGAEVRPKVRAVAVRT